MEPNNALKQPQFNLRILLGSVSLLAFLSVIIFAGTKLSLSDLKSTLTKYLNLPKNSNSIIKSLKTQEVVQEESSIINVVDQVSPSVVSIVAKTYEFDLFSGPTQSEDGRGTGFIVSENGLIVTNSHVVDFTDTQYSVILKDGTSYDVKKVHLDEFSDLAILEISAENLPVVNLGDSDVLKVGQRAIAIGNALGKFQNTVTVGVVSGISRDLTASSGFGDVKTYEGVIQTDAALNPGNSGGPLLNSAGQVIGINVATTQGADNISFAIPVNRLKPILETFLAEGRIIRPYMGISFTMVTTEIAKLRRLPEGAFVSRIVAESPASKAGLERGDIITFINKQPVKGDFSVSTYVAAQKVGDKLELKVDRNGTEVTLIVTLEEVPQNLN